VGATKRAGPSSLEYLHVLDAVDELSPRPGRVMRPVTRTIVTEMTTSDALDSAERCSGEGVSWRHKPTPGA
jgi:hypothetical protein